jgi:HAE1 family hydrophobic/amphiphilic exporter-1
MRNLNMRLAGLLDAQAFAFSPPVIPGIGTSGGVTFMLEDRAGKDPAFLAENTAKFLAAARQRPEFALLFTTLLPGVPQLFADVDRDKVLKQGINLASVYQTLQAFMGSAFVNYFHEFGRVWQVYVQAEGISDEARYRRAVLCAQHPGGQPVPLSSLVTTPKPVSGGVHRALQRVPGGADQRHPAPGVSQPGHAGAQESSRRPCPARWASTTPAYRSRSRWPRRKARRRPSSAYPARRVPAGRTVRGWRLPFGVLLGTPIAVLGAVAALWLGAFRAGRVLADRPPRGDRLAARTRS